MTYFHKNNVLKLECNVDLVLLTEYIGGGGGCIGSVNVQKCYSRCNCFIYVKLKDVFCLFLG
jgi:hypothetical protein